jgi:hypothetical protein
MAILNNSNAISSGSYDVNNSLRFRSSASARLSRTFGSATNYKIQTLSAWVKRGLLSSSTTYRLMGGYNGSAANSTEINFNNDTLRVEFGGAASNSLITTQVFRDPSAWYHIVIAIDTTQATAANRVKMYVNGTQVTAFGTANYPAQNADSQLTSANANNSIGAGWSGFEYFDGYMAEVNFVDGQALTPSSFGETDAVTGSWLPKKYTGTYGTNGFYLPFSPSTTSTYAASFNGSSQYITTPNNSNLALGSGDFTVEFWMNNPDVTNRPILSQAYATGVDFRLSDTGANQLGAYVYGNWIYGTYTTTNQWVHVALTRASNAVKLFVNGVSIASGTVSSTLTADQFRIGSLITGSAASNYFNGSISNVRVVKGTAVYTSNFALPSSPLTAISGTQLLTLQNSTIIDNSANAFTLTNTGSVTTSVSYPFIANITADRSGNGNNWYTNNINYSTSGTTYDAMIDSPTLTSATVANYAVLNPLVGSVGVTLSQANLSATFDTAGGTRYGTIGTIGVSSGKWYWEYEFSAGGNSALVGITQKPFAVQMGAYPGFASGDYGYFGSNGSKYTNDTGSAYGATFTTGDVIGIALDLDAGTLTFYKNNTSQGTAFSSISGTFFPAIGKGITATGITSFVNFGQRPFTYTPPTGFVRLNTYNLPDSTIVKGNTVMDATLYSGTSATQTIVNAGAFKPDFLWLKNRGSVSSHQAINSVAAGFKSYPNLTDAQDSATDFTSFNSNGFTLTGAQNNSNLTGQTYVGWQWQAGQGSTSSNTSGSITSTVSVNATAGFSVATWTGNGTAGATTGHGLGVTPAFVIIKNRTATAGEQWLVWHKSISQAIHTSSVITLNGYTGALLLNGTSASISYGFDGQINGSTNGMLAYCWAEIAGFSRFGSYTGNGSADGPMVWTGFTPKWILFKKTTTGTGNANWWIYDAVRNTYNVATFGLLPNSSVAEQTNSTLDILSNGFKLRNSNGEFNDSSQPFIYAAFASNPFKNSNAF